MKITKLLRTLSGAEFEGHVVKDQKELEGLFSINDEKAVVYIALQENKTQAWYAPAGVKRGVVIKDAKILKYNQKEVVRRQYNIYIKSGQFHHYAGSSLEFDKNEIKNFIHLKLEEGKDDLNKAIARFRIKKMK